MLILIVAMVVPMPVVVVTNGSGSGSSTRDGTDSCGGFYLLSFGYFPVPSIPTVFVPNMTSSDPQTFPTDPYQIAPTSDVQADVSAQVGQVPYSVNFAGAFISEEPVPNQWNHPYSGVTNTQGVPTSMDSEETSLPSRQPSEIHFYGAEAPGSGDNQLYGGDSFEHLRTVPEPNQPSFTQPEKSAEIEQPASQDNFDYYSMANYQVRVQSMEV